MRQVWIPKPGDPEILEIREAPDPDPGPGEVRIRVRASGINFADILARMGLYPDSPPLPTVVGYEVSGVVDGVGAGVDDVADGDRVVSITRFGGYSDCVVVPRSQMHPIPGDLSFEKAAAIPVTYLTSWVMLIWLGNVRAGEKVLVHAAAGGVGQSATQICKWRGAEVIGTASAGKHDRLRQMGVAHCIDYRNEDFLERVKELTGGRGVDIVLDAVGSSSFKRSYNCLAPLGRLFLFGSSSVAPGKKRSLFQVMSVMLRTPKFASFNLIQRNRGVFGVNLGHLWDEGPIIGKMFGEILDLTGQGILDPVVDRTFPLEEAAQAHRYIQDRKNFGKVLLVPSS